MTIKSKIKSFFFSSSSSSPSLFFGLYKLAMNESRLKTNASFASEVTIPTSPSQQHQRKTQSIYTDKSATIAEDQPNKFKAFAIAFKKKVWSLFVKYWFLLGLLVAIVLAIEFPNVARKGGYIRAEWTIKWGKKKRKSF
jgi:sodium/bile acid cotransporter 7